MQTELRVHIGGKYVTNCYAYIAPRVGETMVVSEMDKFFVKTKRKLSVVSIEHVFDEYYGETTTWINVGTEAADE
ncbi:hypothetical protein NGI46_08125 [Peribacillus butanolivorans]|uniref:hypothetical protein n=1 Tax=Peribacillus butanolivorans TaxID=421767 RepID=UPI00207CC9D6|nr:hypothetical protein [Peribacillus butanolivorans]MCO0597434.1 hypothetical protein [Peribacillus butanolivorans]